MEASTIPVEATPTPSHKDYTSRPGALIWCFRKSRDGWKRKYQDLKATIKGLKNRIADLTKSRDGWRLKAEEAAVRIATLERETAALRAEVGAQAEEKKATRACPH